MFECSLAPLRENQYFHPTCTVPWMNLCKCEALECVKEINDYEAVHGPLRNQPRVVIVEDKVIIKDRLLMNTVKKLSDYFDTDESLFYD